MTFKLKKCNISKDFCRNILQKINISETLQFVLHNDLEISLICYLLHIYPMTTFESGIATKFLFYIIQNDYLKNNFYFIFKINISLFNKKHP